MSKKHLNIGTRASALALWQAHWVKTALERENHDFQCDLVTIETKGDKILDTALAKIGDKGLFTKEIEQQLLDGHIDLAVHSLKDMPTAVPQGLKIAGICNRDDPADVLVSKGNTRLSRLAQGAVVLTSSLRRRVQLLHLRADLEVRDVRGNVQTRLRKLDESDAQAMVLAGAGLRRLGLKDRISERLDPTTFLPACGQGALAIEIRQGDEETESIIRNLNDDVSCLTTIAERTVLAELHGGCQVPLGAYAKISKGSLHLWAMLSDLQGGQLCRAEAIGSLNEPVKVGKKVANELMAGSGRDILEQVLADLDRTADE